MLEWSAMHMDLDLNFAERMHCRLLIQFRLGAMLCIYVLRRCLGGCRSRYWGILA